MAFAIVVTVNFFSWNERSFAANTRCESGLLSRDELMVLATAEAASFHTCDGLLVSTANERCARGPPSLRRTPGA